ncbi:ABC transporter related protein [Spirochaeta thermophila DSM 6578]|uniref:ABC transporter related protein n=1 Tax=Winmispira thermophila (strain ATCC 700085 / DSM 6578 / Z-1203) TaxID=869211 RepID=G0GA64_WINT7|nr:ABC transporter ATP-binding protein [Spirochaeta thermophila]AEJ60900.1 ABC transporter related protein [Spirochaeta thermophila DSM 6578]
MKILGRYIARYWYFALGSLVFMGTEVAVNLAQPALMGRVVDEGIIPGDMGAIVRLGLILLGIVLIGVAGGIGCTITASAAATRTARDLRNLLYRKVLRLSLKEEARFGAGTIITRLTGDIVQVQTIVHMLLRMMIRAPLLAIGGIAMSFVLSPRLTLIMLAALPLLSLILILLIRKGIPLFVEAQKETDRLNTVVRENLEGVRVVRAFVRADYEEARFGKVNDRLKEVMTRASRLMGLAFPLVFLIMNLSIVAVLWAGGLLVQQGDIQVGTIIALTNYLLQILFALMMIGFFFMGLSRAQASLLRIAELADAPEESLTLGGKDLQPLGRPASLVVEHLSVSYDGVPALSDLSFEAPPGTRIGVIGPTGSGKTTLVMTLLRMVEPAEGRVLLDGTDIRDLSLEELRARIAVVFQKPVLFRGTVAENLRWGFPDATEDQMIEALTRAQAWEFVSRLPGVLEARIEQGGTNLSGGQRQRLAIARTLIRPAGLLILDDATSALDAATESRLLASLRTLPITTLLISQRMSAITTCDLILVLDDGRLAGAGPHHLLLQQCPLYRELYETQIEGALHA